MQTLTCTIDTTTGALRFDRPLYLGTTYAVALSGAESARIVLCDCDGAPVAASGAEGESEVLALDTAELLRRFTIAGITGEPGCLTFHAWAYGGDGGTLAQSDVPVFYSLLIDAGGTLTRIDTKGATGKRGERGLPGIGMPYFHVGGDGHLYATAFDPHDLWALDGDGNPVYSKPRWKIGDGTGGMTAGHLYHIDYGDDAAPVMVLDVGNARGADGDDGEDGAGIARIEAVGTSADGGKIYRVFLTDGTSYDITAPRGPDISGDIRSAVAGIDAPTAASTQKDLRTSQAALVNALKTLGAALAFGFVMSGALADTIPWEEVPPNTPVDTNAVAGVISLDGYATTNYVNDALAGIDIPDTSLEPATNYTDTVAAGLSTALANAKEQWDADSVLIASLVNGTNVIVEITNYNSRVHAPQMRVLQMDTEEGQYHTVWTETNLHAQTLAKANVYTDAAYQTSTNYAAPRAWSLTTSGLGADAPPGSTWISTPELVIAGGLEYEKHITSGGAIWLLRSNGMSAQFHAATNNAAYLDISDNEGNSIFRIEKTDSVLVGVDVTELSIDGSTLICGINVVASDHPLARVATNLNGSWYSEEDGIPANVATVSWRGASGSWVCDVANTSGGNSLFATFEYIQEGGTKISNAAPLDVSPGILCTDGIHKVRPVWSAGNVITWEVVQ